MSDIWLYMPPAGPKAPVISVPMPGFQAQFALPFIQPLFPAGNAAVALTAAALDSGYGVTPLTAPGLTANQIASLQPYLQARLQMLLATLNEAPAGTLNRNPFVSMLESSEKRDLGYLLGSVLCRVACDRWAQGNLGGPVTRFWHFKVAMKPPVSLLPGPRAHRADNPDYVFEANGHWFFVDAKGSTDDFLPGAKRVWKDLRAGLRQAAKYPAFQFLDPPACVPPFTAAQVQGFGCSHAHFDGGMLRVLLVDPPPDDGDEPVGVAHEPPRPQALVVRPFADLMNHLLALRQFQALGRPLRGTARLAAPPPFLGVRWQSMGRANGTGAPLWVGLRDGFLAQAAALNLAAEALGLLMPYLATGGGIVDASKDELADADNADSTQLENPLPQRSLRRLQAALDDDGRWAPTRGSRRWRQRLSAALAPQEMSSLEGVRRLATCVGLPGRTSIVGLVELLHHEATNAATTVQRLADLTTRFAPDSNFRIKATSHGLLVASGEWPQLPPTAKDELVKI